MSGGDHGSPDDDRGSPDDDRGPPGADRGSPEDGEDGAAARPDADPGGEGSESAGGGPRPDAEFGPVSRRLHPLSVLYRSISGSLNLGTLIFLGTLVASGSVSMNSLFFVVLIVGGLAVSMVYQVLYYYRFQYVVADGSLDISSGVVSRRQREIPLRRIQNVDVGQNPFQRALGIASVRIETAGGGQTEAELRYVSPEEARRLQRELRGRATPEAGEAADTVSGVPEAEEEPVFELRTRDLTLLSAFTIDRGASVIATLFGTVMGVGDPTEMIGVGQYLSLLPGNGLQRVVAALVLIAVAAWVLSFAITFARFYGFRLVRVEDELQYERGLLQRYSGTIPEDKIQTVSVHENVLKRRAGYATLSIETAGYAPGSSQSGGADAAVPLAKRDRVLSIARSIEPFEDVSVERPPKRARLRYAFRYSLAVLVTVGILLGVALYAGVATWRVEYAALFAPVVLAPVAAHFKWSNLGHRVEDDHFVTRAGFWTRSTRVVPYYRIQTVVDARTIFQRRRNLAHVTADTASSSSIVGGDATAHDVDDGRADELRGILRERLQESLRERKDELAAERLASLTGDRSVDETADGSRANVDERTDEFPEDR